MEKEAILALKFEKLNSAWRDHPHGWLGTWLGGIAFSGIELQVRRRLKTDEQGLLSSGRDGGVNLPVRNKGCMAHAQVAPGISLSDINLATQHQKRVVGVVVHVLWELVAWLRFNVIECQ